MGSAAEVIRERIAAEESYSAIVYGQRAMDEMGGWRGCSKEYAGAGWAIAQFENGVIEAAVAIGRDDVDSCDWSEGAAWLMKRGKAAASDRVKAARAAVKAVGSQNQIRLAIALAA